MYHLPAKIVTTIIVLKAPAGIQAFFPAVGKRYAWEAILIYLPVSMQKQHSL